MTQLPPIADAVLAAPAPEAVARGRLLLGLLLIYSLGLVLAWVFLAIYAVGEERNPSAVETTSIQNPPALPGKPLLESLAISSEAAAALEAHRGPLPPGTLEVLRQTCESSRPEEVEPILLAAQNKDATLAARLCASLLTSRNREARLTAVDKLSNALKGRLPEEEIFQLLGTITDDATRQEFMRNLPQLAPGMVLRAKVAELVRSGRATARDYEHFASQAAAQGDVESLRQLLRLGVDPRRRVLAMSPLETAALAGHAEALRLLLGHTGNCPEAAYALAHAAQAGQLACVEILLGADVPAHAKSRGNEPAIVLAAQNGHTGVMERLIEAGADLEAVRPQDELRALHVAKDGRTARLLAAAGANLEAGPRTPLAIAAGDGRVEAMETLLELGAKVEGAAKGLSPLMTAIHQGKLQAVKVLVENGADVNHRDEAGSTPLREARSGGHRDIAKYLEGQGAQP